MRYLTDSWEFTTEVEGPWNSNILTVTTEVSLAAAHLMEFINGTVVVLKSAARGSVLNTHNTLLCAMCGSDGTWVLRAIKASELKKGYDALEFNPLNEQRLSETAAAAVGALPAGPPRESLRGDASKLAEWRVLEQHRLCEPGEELLPMLFRAVEDGGFGLPNEGFCATGYRTDDVSNSPGVVAHSVVGLQRQRGLAQQTEVASNDGSSVVQSVAASRASQRSTSSVRSATSVAAAELVTFGIAERLARPLASEGVRVANFHDFDLEQLLDLGKSMQMRPLEESGIKIAHKRAAEAAAGRSRAQPKQGRSGVLSTPGWKPEKALKAVSLPARQAVQRQACTGESQLSAAGSASASRGRGRGLPLHAHLAAAKECSGGEDSMAALSAAALATAEAQATVAARVAAAAKATAAAEAKALRELEARNALSDGADARAIVSEVAPEVATLVASVPDGELIRLFKLLASNLKVLEADVAWDSWGVLPMVCSKIVCALDNARVSAAEALLRATFSGSELGRVAYAVASLERAGSSARYANADMGGEGDACRGAAQRIADDRDALAAVLEAAKLARSESSEADSLPLLREKVRSMELGPFGADVALLLHQEKLAATPSGTSSSALRVLEKVKEVRGGLASARLALWRRVAPDGVSLVPLIEAVNCGKLTSAVLVGKSPTGGVSAGLARVWPLLMSMSRQMWPRDDTIDYTLLSMWREVVVVGKSSDHAVSIVVDPWVR